MDPELKKMLEENLQLSKENNGMLRAMRRSQKWALLLRGLYWLIIIGITAGAFYFIQPYLTTLSGVYTQGKGIGASLQNIPSARDIQDLFK